MLWNSLQFCLITDICDMVEKNKSQDEKKTGVLRLTVMRLHTYIR